MTDSKHIAVLSTMYYPDMGAPSACIDKYIQSLKHKYKFTIISKTEELKFEPNKEFDIRYISNLFHRIRNKCYNNIKHNKLVLLSKIILLFINSIKFIQTQFSFPNAQKWETNQYLHELEKLNNDIHIDCIIAVSNNFVTQLAALKFKRKNPDIKWIAFITDPYAENYIYYKFKFFKSFWKKLNYKKEQIIYDSCDYALFTSEMYRYVPSSFSIDNNKIHKIEFALKDTPKIEEYQCNKLNNKAETNKKCKLIYAGQFYTKIRNPEFMLRTISECRSLRMDMYVGKGECEDIISKYTGDNILRYEFVDHDKYLNMIYSEYDILINVGNNASLQAPSKMLDLISTGKPIINFYHSKDSQYEMIEKYPLGLNVGVEQINAPEIIENFCFENKGKSISFAEIEKMFPHNKLSYQVELLESLINS